MSIEQKFYPFHYYVWVTTSTTSLSKPIIYTSSILSVTSNSYSIIIITNELIPFHTLIRLFWHVLGTVIFQVEIGNWGDRPSTKTCQSDQTKTRDLTNDESMDQWPQLSIISPYLGLWESIVFFRYFLDHKYNSIK